jgi:hypothetical protein
MINTLSIRLEDYYLEFFKFESPSISMIAAKKNAFGRTHPRRHASNYAATRLSSPPKAPAPRFYAAIFGDFALPLGDSPNLKLY